MPLRALLALGTVIMLTISCSPSPAPPSSSPSAGAGESPAAAVSTSGRQPSLPQGEDDDKPLPEVPSPYDALPQEARNLLDKTYTDDLDAMVKRRLIRAGVVFNRTQYFIDKGVQRGISYESISLFEEELNKRLKTGLLKVHIAFVPLSRDQLFPALQAGKVDFVAAALTITPERRKLVDFSIPTRTGVAEIVVTLPLPTICRDAKPSCDAAAATTRASTA
jgi:ABC-type amino acid transport substrate-binding protein